MTFNRELSQHVGRLVRAENHECYRNAVLGLMAVHEPGARYVEGWAVRFILTPHGWIELADGTVVDPTPAYQDGEARYFPGRYYTADEVEDRVGDGAVTLPFDEDFQHEMIPPDLMREYLVAHAATYGEDATRMLVRWWKQETPSEEVA